MKAKIIEATNTYALYMSENEIVELHEVLKSLDFIYGDNIVLDIYSITVDWCDYIKTKNLRKDK